MKIAHLLPFFLPPLLKQFELFDRSCYLGPSMGSRLFVTAALAAATLGAVVAAQDFKPKPPTAADWAALARLPDFNGVWEAGPAGGRAVRAADELAQREACAPAAGRAGRKRRAPARGRAGGPPAGPSLTPAYAAMRKHVRTRPRRTTNRELPAAGHARDHGQPYPMEFLLTPGLVTIVIEAYQQVRHIYTDGRPLPADPDRSSMARRSAAGTAARWSSRRWASRADAARGQHAAQRQDENRRALHAVGSDTMTIETTITDPEALTAPFASTRTCAAIATGRWPSSARRTAAIRSIRVARPPWTSRGPQGSRTSAGQVGPLGLKSNFEDVERQVGEQEP